MHELDGPLHGGLEHAPVVIEADTCNPDLGVVEGRPDLQRQMSFLVSEVDFKVSEVAA